MESLRRKKFKIVYFKMQFHSLCVKFTHLYPSHRIIKTPAKSENRALPLGNFSILLMPRYSHFLSEN